MMHQAKRATKRAIAPKKSSEQLQQNDIEKALNMLNLFNRSDNHRVDLSPNSSSNTAPPSKAKIS